MFSQRSVTKTRQMVRIPIHYIILMDDVWFVCLRSTGGIEVLMVLWPTNLLSGRLEPLDYLHLQDVRGMPGFGVFISEDERVIEF